MTNNELKELVYNTVRPMFPDDYELKIVKHEYNSISIAILHITPDSRVPVSGYTVSQVGYPIRVYAIMGKDKIVKYLKDWYSMKKINNEEELK